MILNDVVDEFYNITHITVIFQFFRYKLDNLKFGKIDVSRYPDVGQK